MKNRFISVTAVCLTLLLALSACGNGAASAGDSARLQELGSVFIGDVQTVLPYMEDDVVLTQGIVDSEGKINTVTVLRERLGDRTYNIDCLSDFYDRYRVSEDAEVFFIFSTSSFVMSKLESRGGKCYYFRYEYDPANPEEINVVSQLVDKVSIDRDNGAGKLTLTLRRAKSRDIVLTFKNYDREESLL